MSEDIELLKRHLEREKKARIEAETLLETKARELYYTNKQLEEKKNILEEKIQALQDTQAQLLQSEKMASLGVIVAGVAHEINSPLGFILSNTEILGDFSKGISEIISVYQNIIKKSITDPSIHENLKSEEEQADIDFILESLPEVIDDILEGGERIQGIIHNLKMFSHSDNDFIENVNINDILDFAVRVVFNEIKYKASVSKHYGTLPPISCIPGQLTQVFTNLIINASQAIEEKGSIILTTTVNDTVVLIKITDTGSGIKEEDLTQIFTPFYTTKPVGIGTGLGLSVSFNIIQKHGGTISVESALGKGTTFTIQLPLSSKG